MYRRIRFTEELTRQEMERARRAFVGLLQRRGFSWRFVEEEGEEALAIAHTEFTRAIRKGVDVEEPVAWTVNCAWQRTKNHLTAESRRPRSVSTEHLLELEDEGAPDPEEILEEAERARKIREAIAELNEAQRQVIALTYFEGMSVREAARRLGWHPSKAQYAHKTAIKSLFEYLGVSSSDQLTVEIGLAAFLTFGAREGASSLPAGVEAVIDRAGHGATGIWARLQEAARRLGGGGGDDTAGVIVSSGAGRAAGVCAAGVAVVCLGTAGVIGGVGIGGGHHERQTPPPHEAPQARVHDQPGPRHTPAPFVEEEASSVATTTTPSGPTPRRAATGAGPKTSSTGVGSKAGSAKKEPTPAAGISQPRRLFRGTDRALVAAESSGTGGREEATSGESSSSSSSSSSTSSSSSSGSGAEGATAAEKSAAKSQFDAFAKAR